MRSPSPTQVLESIAANTARVRRQRGFTQEELAEEAEIDLRFLQRIERATTNLGVVVLAKLADALDVEPGRLLRPARLPPPVRGRPKQKPPHRRRGGTPV